MIMPRKVSRRRKKKKKIKYFRILMAFVVVVLLVIGFFNLPIFNITNINVVGNERVDQASVINASGFEIGDSFIFFNKENIEEKILNLPLVEEVRVKRNFPNNINIEVSERKPASTVQLLESFLLLDRFGYVIDKVDNLMLNLTLLKGIEENDSINIGDQIFEFVSEEKNNLLKLMYNGDNIYKYKMITLEDHQAELILSNDIVVGFGSYNNVEYKLDVIDQMVKTIEEDSSRQASMILMEEGPNPILVYE